MDKEMDALYKNETWNLCPLPLNKKAIRCKWLYKLKFNKEVKVDRYKARPVAKGFAQQHGLDYDETYALVAKMSSIKLLISLASIFKWKLKQMDVNNAFLNGLLEEEVYMQQPKGYVVAGKEGMEACERLRDAYAAEFEDELSDDDDGWVGLETEFHHVGIPKVEEKEVQKEAGQESLKLPLDTSTLPLERAHRVETEYPLLKLMSVLSLVNEIYYSEEKQIIHIEDVFHGIKDHLKRRIM
ncbi:hypothetical protein L7F22_033554 [Adiantum nelumboides]|nr:hypothetical protein [Adiantum nelumboides]